MCHNDKIWHWHGHKCQWWIETSQQRIQSLGNACQVPLRDPQGSQNHTHTDEVISFLLTVMRGSATDGWGPWVSSQVQSKSGPDLHSSSQNRWLKKKKGSSTSLWDPGACHPHEQEAAAQQLRSGRSKREATESDSLLVSAPLLWQCAAHTLFPHSDFSTALPRCLNLHPPPLFLRTLVYTHAPCTASKLKWSGTHPQVNELNLVFWARCSLFWPCHGRHDWTCDVAHVCWWAKKTPRGRTNIASKKSCQNTRTVPCFGEVGDGENLRNYPDCIS